ncbi:aminotransferase class I/II-fold pyridoxal phosphate-dependent enzyme [Desulforhopalus singaporensis]|uniref:Glycine C-acetyltransferase n=1 Tax=Desulforhopalus singaporensis TaxID=91360 RepID=A0A1H0TYN6_9BACT|nr:aminotransferase class I/II-fold pyridoxal phosphate-dependent enzyme [Desulforhopalus singaporensis]SDP59182.1 glycine C-acetyltransferase [Desulforhopalus singaporensis]
MSLQQIDATLQRELQQLAEQGRAKPRERVITDYVPAKNGSGPRYRLEGQQGLFIRMNSNSYLSLGNHPALIAAADEATRRFGTGPGAVRFIDGTYCHHTALEKRIALFMDKPAAKIFNSAYTANCGLALAINSATTLWAGDRLNHNSIIRAMRICGVPGENKAIFNHNDVQDLDRCLDSAAPGITRVIVVFDGIFSMRGDFAPTDRILQVIEKHKDRFADGIISVIDDSHGIGAYGKTGRGTAEFCGAAPDIIVGTFGKAFGVNGGFVCTSATIVETIRQKADTYIYTNPLSMADCAAATRAIDICDSKEGLDLLKTLNRRTRQFREGLEQIGLETIPGPHPIVPLLVRDTMRTRMLVNGLFDHGILAVGLTFPVVPKGDETIRFQINCAHTKADIDYVLEIMAKLVKKQGCK